MLTTLRIENFALIHQLSLEFSQGLNVLTGETGAGKSIIIDALDIMLGGRSATDYIRTGYEKAVVEGVFENLPSPITTILAELGVDLDDDGILILSREIHKGGKNVCRINGRPATLAMLKELGQHLIDIHGQHEHQSLLQREKHLDLLDLFGGPVLMDLRTRTNDLYQRMREVQQRLKVLANDEKARNRKLDLLKFQLAEIDGAKMQVGEDQALAAERSVLANAEKLFAASAKAYELLYEGTSEQNSVIDGLNAVISTLSEVSKIDPKLTHILEVLESSTYQLEDASREIRKYRDHVEFNPHRLAEVEERYNLLNQLKRKYGDSLEEILNFREQIAQELALLENSEAHMEELKLELGKIRNELTSVVIKLSAKRREVAVHLSQEIREELKNLDMKHAIFEVKIDYRPAIDGLEIEGEKIEVGPKGIDHVEFLFSSNPGESPKPLTKIISGGEMSRVMLALKTILAKVDTIPILIFDEVDTGVSGRAAQAVADKLARLGSLRQVICVTHLPQIACMADAHFYIHKEVKDGRTQTIVQPLVAQARVEEIARLLGGAHLTAISLQHAQEMLKMAKLSLKSNKHAKSFHFASFQE